MSFKISKIFDSQNILKKIKKQYIFNAKVLLKAPSFSVHTSIKIVQKNPRFSLECMWIIFLKKSEIFGLDVLYHQKRSSKIFFLKKLKVPSKYTNTSGIFLVRRSFKNYLKIQKCLVRKPIKLFFTKSKIFIKISLKNIS